MDITFDLEESLHAESVINRGKSLEKVSKIFDLLRVNIMKRKGSFVLFRLKVAQMSMKAAE